MLIWKSSYVMPVKKRKMLNLSCVKYREDVDIKPIQLVPHTFWFVMVTVSHLFHNPTYWQFYHITLLQVYSSVYPSVCPCNNIRWPTFNFTTISALVMISTSAPFHCMEFREGISIWMRWNICSFCRFIIFWRVIYDGLKWHFMSKEQTPDQKKKNSSKLCVFSDNKVVKKFAN